MKKQIKDSSLPEEALVVLNTSLEVLSVNCTAREMLDPGLEYGKKILLVNFIAKDDLTAVKSAVNLAMVKGEAKVDIGVMVRTPSGSNVTTLLSTYPLYETPESILGVILSLKYPKSILPGSKICNAGYGEKNGALIEQRSLLEALPEGVFTINTKWRIASFNRTAEKITGYTKEEVLGKYCWEIFRSDLCDLGCPLRDALETGKAGTDQDIRILKKEGGRQTILVNTGVLKDDKGLIVGAVETFRPLTGEISPPKGTSNAHSFSNIIGKSKSIKRLFALLPDIAASETNVFITGESGTGKELFARTIHDNSSRAKHPFVAVNCSALAETLLESELFGHEKSAFTGATEAKSGRFELVKHGTLFLDEIGELKPSLQIKLLRVIEQREFERVGGTVSIPLKARIISATNKDLTLALENGSFREDFYYRLRTVPLIIPPLRERPEDIPLLVEYFIQRYNPIFKKNVKGVASQVMELFMDYHWPGNVRELERTIEHAFVFVKGPVILPGNLPQLDVFSKKTASEIVSGNNIKVTKELIVQALKKTGGKKKNAAQLLGISRTSLWRKMKAYNLL